MELIILQRFRRRK